MGRTIQHLEVFNVTFREKLSDSQFRPWKEDIESSQKDLKVEGTILSHLPHINKSRFCALGLHSIELQGFSVDSPARSSL